MTLVGTACIRMVRSNGPNGVVLTNIVTFIFHRTRFFNIWVEVHRRHDFLPSLTSKSI